MHRMPFHSLTLSLTLVLACAGHAQGSKDSVWVCGGLFLASDSIALDMDWTLDGQTPKPGADTLWTQVSRNSELTAWARNDYAQVQMASSWPRWADSIEFTLVLDTMGLNLRMPEDTLTALWKPLQSGCFPATSVRDLEEMLASLSETPFEAKRYDVAVVWLSQHCLTIPGLRRLADGFDDERRRLSLLQSARITHPEALLSLGSLFFTARYQEEFRQWVEASPSPH